VVTCFTEDYGIMKGVARGSLKMKSKISGTLEPLTLVNLRFVQPHGRELVVITGSDALRSLFNKLDKISTALAVGLITEVTLESHKEHDPNEDMFRLLELCQLALKQDKPALMVMHYFELFTLRLNGLLPPASEIKVNEARELMQLMLRTNLMELEIADRNALKQLGAFLRSGLRNALGKNLRSYSFMDKMRLLRRTKLN
jgi:hypothetical protein